MPGTRKPRKAYKPRPVQADAWGLAIDLATKLSRAQQRAYNVPAQAALASLRTATGGWAAWCAMADVVNVAQQLALRNIASDKLTEFAAAQAALQALHARVNATQRWALYAAELAALDLAVLLHAIQLQHCTQGELRDAIQAVQRICSQALQGNAGPRHTVSVGAIALPPGTTPAQRPYALVPAITPRNTSPT